MKQDRKLIFSADSVVVLHVVLLFAVISVCSDLGAVCSDLSAVCSDLCLQ